MHMVLRKFVKDGLRALGIGVPGEDNRDAPLTLRAANNATLPGLATGKRLDLCGTWAGNATGRHERRQQQRKNTAVAERPRVHAFILAQRNLAGNERGLECCSTGVGRITSREISS